MPRQPIAALQVTDLAASLRFYGEALGFSVIRHDPTADVAEIDLGSFPLLLAGPVAGDLTRYLGERPLIITLDEALDLDAPTHLLPENAENADPDALRARLVACGLTNIMEEEKSWGDRVLSLPDPSHRLIRLWIKPQLSREDMLALYAQGPDALEGALAKTVAADLDWRPKPGAWTIRETVHHLAEVDALWAMTIKAALLRPGVTLHQEAWVGNDGPSQWLDYAGRAIVPAIVLLRANREYTIHLLRHLPNAWDSQALITRGPGQEPRAVAVSQMVRDQIVHHLEHVEEIRETHQKRQEAAP